MNKWLFKLQYAVWGHAIQLFYGYALWQWKRERMFRDEYIEEMHDMLGCYCMGGEL